MIDTETALKITFYVFLFTIGHAIGYHRGRRYEPEICEHDG